MSDPTPKTRAELVQDLFDQASALPANQRRTFLDKHCVGDPAMRAEIDALLTADERAGGFLADPTIEPNRVNIITARDPTPTADDLRQIGPYKLLQLIGEGGFGTVYLAEQQSPVRRRVALKVIKLGMDTKQVIARFEAERQALAMMDHPNIARVFDAGATEAGRPFFVMELVNGVPITQYCDANRLSARQRLELFIPVCQAVQHAHQKGIIHRDIKPTNVLVTLHDGRPVPKVIDFGVAKATQARLTEKTLFTELRTMIGTPEYMSPEQAEMSGLDVDTRSDVYSLGVLMYELLTGVTPFDPRELRSKAFAEMQRVIREVDPLRPSTRLSTIGTIASIAASRSIEPKKLHALVRGELDWIVMKCLEKDRTRRYESASSLAGDIMRYLADEPVEAAAPSQLYRAQKFVRRHKWPVIASATILLVLVAGIVGTTIGLIGQSRQRAEAQKQAAEAQKQAAIAEAISDFQSDMLASADPEKMFGNKVTVLQAVTAAVKELDAGRLADQPLVEANVRETIGKTLRGLGSYNEAEPNLRKALELRRSTLPAGDPTIAQSQSSLAWLLRDQGKYADAEQLVREAADIYRKSGDDRNTAATLGGVGVLLQDQGKFAEAEVVIREALAIRRRSLPPAHQDIGRNLSNLAAVLHHEGKYDEALSTYREGLEIYRKSLPAGHPHIASNLNNMALMLNEQGRPAEAEPLFREALEMRRAALPPGHQEIAGSLISLAGVVRDLGKLDEAEPLARQGLEIYQKALPAGHPGIAGAQNVLAKVLDREGRFAEAEPLYREAVASYQSQFGKNNIYVGLNRLGLGITLGKMNRFAEAEPELLEADRILSIAQGVPPAARQQCYEALVADYTSWDKSDPGKGHDAQARQWQSKLAATSRPATTTPSGTP